MNNKMMYTKQQLILGLLQYTVIPVVLDDVGMKIYTGLKGGHYETTVPISILISV